jgi:hypothetical protein
MFVNGLFMRNVLLFVRNILFFNLDNTATNKNCLKRKFDVVKGRTCDDKNPAFQAVVGSGTLTASCASLACGYEDKALRATGENVIAVISISDNDNVQTQCIAFLRRTVDNQNHKNHINHSSDTGDDKSPKGLIFITARSRPAEKLTQINTACKAGLATIKILPLTTSNLRFRQS